MAAQTSFGPTEAHNNIAGNQFSGPTTLNFGRYDSKEAELSPFSTVPFLPDPDFVERTGVATWLHDTLIPPGSRAALVGLGGVGKSQVAIQYAHHIQQESPSTYVFWVHAGTRARFEEAYRSIADRLQLPRRYDSGADVLRLVHDWLFNVDNGPWLMILDSADDADVFYSVNHDRTTRAASTQRLLASFVPQSSNGRILVTSRSNDLAERLVGSSWRVLPIQPMDEGQARQLLQKKLRDKYEDETAASLVRALDYIPLAITQAAAYILRRWPRASPLIYLEELRKSEKKKQSLLHRDHGDLRRDTEASNSVVLTWQITFEQIQQERRSAAKLLSFMSLFHPQGIPEWILRSYYMRRHEYESHDHEHGKGDDDSDDNEALDELDDDLETLRGYSLVDVTAQQDAYEMHALVQLCTRVWLSSTDNKGMWGQVFLRVMSEEYPNGNHENWTKCQELEPHIALIIEREPATTEGKGHWAQLLTNSGWYGWQMGRYKAAEGMLRKAVEIREKVLGGERNNAIQARGQDHSDTLRSLNALGVVLRDQGKYEEAEQMNRRALDGCEKVLGKDHPHTLTSVTNLALILGNQGKYEEAEHMNRRALDGCEKALGKDHPYTLTSVSNLAGMLRFQGKYEEAEQMSRRALDGFEKTLGKDHPSTLTIINNLALVLGNQGKYEEAEPMNRRALDGSEKALGKDHPHTLTTVGNLAGVLRFQGKYEAAERMNRRALDGTEKALGKNHPDTLKRVSTLARVLGSQGKYEEAEQMNRRAIDGYEKALGKDHPDTLTSVSNLALVLGNQGKYEEAEHMNRRVLDGCEKALGKDHPDTLTSVSNLAGVLGFQGKYEEAEQMNRRALDGSEKALGKDHPDTLTSVSNLALVLGYQGKYEEAGQMNQRALDGYEKAVGKDHPSTLTSVSNLAGVLGFQGKYEEAEQMYRRALDSREKALGKDHPDTLVSIYCLAYLYQQQHRLEEADQLYLTALDGFRKVLGPAHPKTLACEGYYASLQRLII